jgi:hypothetical protein
MRARDHQFADGPSTLATHDLARLVGGHGHQPGSQVVRVADIPQPLPCLGPGGLLGLLGHVQAAADEKGDARHVTVVRCHDPREGCCRRPGAIDDGPAPTTFVSATAIMTCRCRLSPRFT